MNEEQMKRALTNAIEISNAVNKMTGNISRSILKVAGTIGQIFSQVSKIISTEFMTGFSNALRNFAIDIEEAKNNPNSYFNYMKYQKDLDDVHWAWPYEIEPKELKSLLENVYTEKEFDALMRKFFNKNKINKMTEEMQTALPPRHKMMLKQAKNAFDRGDYAIANNALMSIIDNMISEYLFNKGQNKRVGVLEPIIKFYEGFPLGEVDFIFELCMLSNNINFIFQDYRFDEKVEIKTNKKIRRHPSLHGVRYSNKKTDALLLFNTLINLIQQQSILNYFKNSLVVDKKTKEFVFSSQMKKQLDEKKCIDFIESIIQLEGEVTHKELLKRIDNIIPENIDNKGKYLSNLLQKMKRYENGLRCKSNDGKRYWSFRSANIKDT